MRKVLVLSLLLVLLSACFPSKVGVGVSFGFDLTPTIVRLEPDRGTGSTYRLGEFVRFVVSLNRPGYVALVAIDSDGAAYEFSRYYLEAGTHLLAGPQGRPDLGFQLRPPGGIQRVRAIYTDTQYPASVRFEGVYRGGAWDRQTSLYIQSSGARVRDVAETYFYIR